MTEAAPPQRDLLVVVPTYNEHDNLVELIEGIRTTVPEADILVVDDASPDGTGKLADSIARTDGQVHVLHRTSKEGLGAAYLAGFAWALNRGYDVIGEMDADGSHQPEQSSSARWTPTAPTSPSSCSAFWPDSWTPTW